MKSTLRILDIVEDTMVDGPGFRTSIYCAGCRHQCPGCHNPQSWAFDQGREMTVEEIMRVVEADPYTRGVTFSGGDPMYQAAGFAELARQIHRRTQKDVWCYTGYDYEKDILAGKLGPWETTRKLLDLIDILVDGEFHLEEKDLKLRFRGSSNQRVIDVKKSLASDEIVLWDDNEGLYEPDEKYV